MKEIREILDTISAFTVDERGVLATVVGVRGSSYRLPGARMLILASDKTVGTVSGGCLEADVLERAKQTLKTHRTEVLTYDTSHNQDSVFNMNMGCHGVIRILMEPVVHDSLLISKLRAAVYASEKLTIATAVSADSSTGGRAFYDTRSGLLTEGLPPFLAGSPQLRDACSRFYFSDKRWGSQTLSPIEGSVEFIFENIEPPLSLSLFGAGEDARPVARIASEVGWQVKVYDHRSAYLTGERFPTAHALVLQNIGEPFEPDFCDRRTAVVIMTHNYVRDRSLLPAVLLSDAFYVGVLGPKWRTEQLLEEVSVDGSPFTDEQLARLYAPVGLDIGAATPETIALSILGEIQSVLASRDGGQLRGRQGPIYDHI